MSKRDQALKLVADILYARRNRDIMREQRAHERLEAWCRKHNYDFGQVLADGTAYLRRNDIAAIMNSL